MEQQKLAALGFQAAARDLDHIVRNIAARYIVQGVPLTWRLLHALEAEAFADADFVSRHGSFIHSLFQRPAEMAYPETDDLVDFGQSNALPAAFAFAAAAYEEAQRETKTHWPSQRGPVNTPLSRSQTTWGG
jgi:hypothetical protein